MLKKFIKQTPLNIIKQIGQNKLKEWNLMLFNLAG